MLFSSWLSRRKSPMAGSLRRTATAARRPYVELLENRYLLSGSPPAVLISGPATVAEAPYGSYLLNLTSVDPKNGPVSQWTIDWDGDGAVDQTLSGNPSSVTDAYAAGPASLNIRAWAEVGGETFA